MPHAWQHVEAVMSISRWKTCFCSTAEQLRGYCGLAIAGALGISVVLRGQSYFVTKARWNVDSYRCTMAWLGERHSALGWCPLGLFHQQPHRGRTRQDGQRSAVWDPRTQWVQEFVEAAGSLLSVSSRRVRGVVLLWRLVVQSGAEGPTPGLQNASHWHCAGLIGPSAREEGPRQRYMRDPLNLSLAHSVLRTLTE